jgi:hypothetical protein
MMLMYALSTADIRVKNIGDTHPRIYLELLKRMLPDKADDLEEVWSANGFV